MVLTVSSPEGGDRLQTLPMRRSQLCAAAKWSTAPTPMVVRGWALAPPPHSYSVCRNRISASGARNRANLVFGGSSRASAFSFIAKLASM